MIPSETLDRYNAGKIHIAQVRNGGNASWAVKDGSNEDSVRLAWYNQNGRFDPFSSAELPLWGLLDLVQEAAKRDMFSKSQLAETIDQLTASVYRQT
jgi:hypothetical protein